MTTPTRDGTYQSVAEKDHDQAIPGGEAWTALRWIDPTTTPSRQTSLPVLEPGAPHDIDYAGKIDAQPIANLYWTRIQRYPVDAADNGTHWHGPFRTIPGEATYFAGGGMDRKNAEAGHGYGADIKCRRPATVSQYILKTDPR